MIFVMLVKEKFVFWRLVSDKLVFGYDYELEVLCIIYCFFDVFNKRKRE